MTSPDNFMAGALPQEEDEQREFEAAYTAFQLRQAITDALTRLDTKEVTAIIEHELQPKKRMH